MTETYFLTVLEATSPRARSRSRPRSWSVSGKSSLPGSVSTRWLSTFHGGTEGEKTDVSFHKDINLILRVLPHDIIKT